MNETYKTQRCRSFQQTDGSTAHNAAPQLAKMVIACAGYRVVGLGHHLATFEAVEIAMGPPIVELVTYFDTCRRKRNQVDYDRLNAATETEADELQKKAEEFRDLVEEWIFKNYPHYSDEA